VPRVTVIVPCRNEKDYIESCLQSIAAQEMVPGGVEIIVADGMSDDGTRDILARLANENARIKVIDNPRGIVSTALNAGIRAAGGKIIIRMDAHTTYSPDYIHQCVSELERAHADNVGGPWVALGEGFISKSIAAAFESPFCTGGARGHDPLYEGTVDTVYLGCWPRDVFNRVGFFDEELVRNQDDEFNLRILRAGGKIYQSRRIKSWYRPRGSLKGLFKQYMQWGYWKIRVMQKHKRVSSWRHIVPGGFLVSLIILALLSLRSRVALWTWAGLVATYVLSNISISAWIAAHRRWKLLFALPLVFACYHVAFGCGFLCGIWDFILFRRRPRRTFTSLSRASPGLAHLKTASRDQ
jgi:succinoglycan biosynthesis protein ExoA